MMGDIFLENHRDITAFKSESEADATISKLETDVNRIEEQIQSLTAAIGEASAARGRVESLHKELGRRYIHHAATARVLVQRTSSA